MKRSKNIIRLIDETNAYLRYKKIKSVHNDLFYANACFLMNCKMYKGYKCYVDIKDESTGLTHAEEKQKTDNFDYIQFI